MKSSPWTDQILTLPRAVKRLFALGLDAVLCAVSVYVAFCLRLGEWVNPLTGPPHAILGSIAIALPIFVSFGLYRTIFRHAGWSAIATVAQAVGLYAIPYIFIYSIVGVLGVPRTIGIIQPMLLFLLVASSRLLARAYLGAAYQALWRNSEAAQVLVYGAGSAGRQLVGAIGLAREMRLVGFVDDDPDLWRATINGVPVFRPDELASVVQRRQVTDILLAIPSATRARRAEIVAQLRELNLHVRTLPGLMDMARGAVSINDLRDLEIEDLLGRSPVPPDQSLLQSKLKDKVVLVTGAGGSIGSELCRQIAAAGPAKLVLVEVCEYNLYAVHQDLLAIASTGGIDPDAITPMLGSVCDPRRMEEIIATWRPDTIFHAAAYKHVPLVEHNVVEGVRNNLFGTLTVAKLAEEYGCGSFVLISTDKAVRPTNVMGTSKRLSEMVLQAMYARGSDTSFSMVRFGNVLGSSGSVVPLFRSQLAAGGPITITHLEITRYFMTIPEAAQLVLHASAMAVGGEVFLLDMGEPVKIADLARNVIELSGLTVRGENRPDGDIEIRVVGLRPGEKLYEELLIGEDSEPTAHPRILRSHESFLPWDELTGHLDQLRRVLDEGDAAEARMLIQLLVPEYAPNSPLVDWVSSARGTATAAARPRKAASEAIVDSPDRIAAAAGRSR